METKAQEFGGSIKQQVSRLGHEAGVFSAVIYYNPVYGRFDGAAYVPEGHDVPDVNRLLRVLLNGTGPIVLQHPARSSSSEPRTGTPLQDGNATVASENGNVVDAAVALCCMGQSSSAIDSPQKRPPDDARLHTTHGSGKGVCPDVAVGTQNCSDGPAHAGLGRMQNAASKARPISHANRSAEQRSFLAVGDAARGSVASAARQQSDPSHRKPIPLGIVESNAELGQPPASNATSAKAGLTRHAQQTARARRLHFFRLVSEIARTKGMADAQSAPVDSAIRHVDQTESTDFEGLPRIADQDHCQQTLKEQRTSMRTGPFGVLPGYIPCRLTASMAPLDLAGLGSVVVDRVGPWGSTCSVHITAS
ncbi:hypothetical protein CLIM01_11019 [Colletotrichum limetticola]|uniref:Uncharacterized protein n=1 Tax=Colletotrichum limetticola TaxID=1209924 RepID=A0ABQ9PHV5_9PEZI|nr:hypothetical protein CLIM01_11019 [Colletotrichum limetticola]